MNIYLLEQDEVRGYDTFDAMVVVAASEEDARNMTPHSDSTFAVEVNQRLYGIPYDPTAWCAPKYVRVTLLGSSNEDVPRVVLESFNAG